jgi:hypothetical protein
MVSTASALDPSSPCTSATLSAGTIVSGSFGHRVDTSGRTVFFDAYALAADLHYSINGGTVWHVAMTSLPTSPYSFTYNLNTNPGSTVSYHFTLCNVVGALPTNTPETVVYTPLNPDGGSTSSSSSGGSTSSSSSSSGAGSSSSSSGVDGSSTSSSGAVIPIPPPKNVTATTIARTGIRLTWTLEPRAAVYDIYRGTNADFVPSPSNRVRTVSGASYDDTGLTRNTVYYYYVRGRTGSSESINSNLARAATR